VVTSLYSGEEDGIAEVVGSYYTINKSSFDAQE